MEKSEGRIFFIISTTTLIYVGTLVDTNPVIGMEDMVQSKVENFWSYT